MDAETLNLLQVDLEAQGREINDIYEKIEERRDGFENNVERLESLAFHMHNLYCAFEGLFRMIAEAFENKIANGGAWHVELLSRMKEEIPGVRPALITTDDDYRTLDELRAFRHVFRHAYAIELDPEKVAIVLKKAVSQKNCHEKWLRDFIETCRSWLT